MLPCLNCQTPVEPKDAKIFAEVFVCPQCFSVAERLEQRAAEELKALLLILREAIRVALIERRLILGPAEPLRDLTKKEVLEQIITLAEKADANRARVVTGDSDQSPLTSIVHGEDVRVMGDARGKDS